MGRAKPRSRQGSKQTGQLRLIGGDWRRRPLSFPAVDDVRPTPDRVRETLFNWLMPVVPGSHCLDLFAGSGALGLEALSRGAASATFVDRSPALVRALTDNLQTLNASDRSTVIQADCQQWLTQPPAQSFDLIFMDPPFRQSLITPLCEQLAQSGWLRDDAWVYMEHEREWQAETVPAHWQVHRQKTAGQVCYRLYRVQAARRV